MCTAKHTAFFHAVCFASNLASKYYYLKSVLYKHGVLLIPLPHERFDCNSFQYTCILVPLRYICSSLKKIEIVLEMGFYYLNLIGKCFHLEKYQYFTAKYQSKYLKN